MEFNKWSLINEVFVELIVHTFLFYIIFFRSDFQLINSHKNTYLSEI
jgi:hypothetical protein